MKFYIRNFLLLVVILITLSFSYGCSNKLLDLENESKIIAFVPRCHNGDAKFWNNKIVTSINGILTLFDFNGNLIKTYNTISADWIGVCPEDNIIIYGNFNKQTGIAKFDTQYNLLSNNIIFEGNLQIDPTIIKKQDCYYITVTQIQGNVNNADPKVQNGKYSILCYQSEDLINWRRMGTPASSYNNLEDVDFFYKDDKMYLIFEKEKLDKGPSSICMSESSDSGRTWSQTKDILRADCDHEPACITNISGQGFRLYYSCDKDDIGSSYMGAKIYCALLDENFDVVQQDIEIQTVTQKGILLYDVVHSDDTVKFLYAKNYLTDCDMVVEEKK